MFNLFSDLRGLSLRTREGNTGSVDDLYFDDRDWAIRYVVADIGGFLTGRKALLGTDIVGRPDVDKGEWPVDADKDDLETAPSPEASPPVSEQRTTRLYRADEPYPPVILGPSGAAYTPFMAEYQLDQLYREREREDPMVGQGDTHLRSLGEVQGYAIRGEGGERIGSVQDYLVNPLDWRVRYIVADTGDWLPGRKVVLPVETLGTPSWEKGEIEVELNRHQVESSPEPEDVSGLKEAEDESLFRHFGL